MTLSSKMSREFDLDVRQRGTAYFKQRLVRLHHGSNENVGARVMGSRDYEVSLHWDGRECDMWCDCEYFDSNGPCKHLWATVLAAESRGYLSSVDFGQKFTPTAPAAGPTPQPVVVAPPANAWRRQISEVARAPETDAAAAAFTGKRQILYIVDAPATLHSGCLILALASRDRKLDGAWSRQSVLNLKRGLIPQLPLAEDRAILAALAGGKQYYGWSAGDSYEQVPSLCQVLPPLAGEVVRLAAGTGRCYYKANSSDDLSSLAWDEGGPWHLFLELLPQPNDGWALAGYLRRGEERMDLAEPALVVEGGLVFTHDRVALLAADTSFEWLMHLRKSGQIQAPADDRDEFLGALLSAPRLPALDVPEEMRFEEVTPQPRPRLHVHGADRLHRSSGRLRAELSYDYEGRVVGATDQARGFFDPVRRRFLRRDLAAEAAAVNLLGEVGVRYQGPTYYEEPAWEIAPTRLPRIVRTLVDAGWHIEADGKVFRRHASFNMSVSSGVDWFELHGEVCYGETTARLPALLAALRRGDKLVRLDDGSYGMLPEEWLRRIGPLAGLGAAEEDHIRFRRSQAGLLDALLATQPEASFDESFARMRAELRSFEGVTAPDQPAGFVGQLRDYQREGLGWMHFLRRFAFGGCLADDMGVGKTAQVLALFETRRELRAAGEVTRPSLVVVPKSLVFNWKQEAARFTPQLRVLDYTGLARENNDFSAHDVVITTYGTLRRDALRLKDVEFDYIVLDESQAVKNAATESSKAVRLLRGEHRLALSGTPVENHLGELWTLFEFLNPGMLGAASVFKLAGGAARNPDDETRRLLAHALRPFILRRTKQQVARELPAKTEQTIYCELEPQQRRLYDELRRHYRASLLKRIETDGMAKSKIQVLEALLRLRQAACHPALIDHDRLTDSSAKLEVLQEQLGEVLEGGHKALVFSQFTSLLKIVRQRLDDDQIRYEYLDGATANRQACVERFQTDPACSVFLISLKAGGLGLNLTAAEYVFLLDPWWNPAAEMQAVDRAHRIGQTRQVFAYRLIARDTVEEKVLELQNSKRDLAAAIINQDNSVISGLRREDLEMLLS